MLPKLERPINGADAPNDYRNIFFEEPSGDRTRLVIGPSSGHVQHLKDLSSLFDDGPWCVLYVLLIPRRGNRSPGRYQSPFFYSHEELSSFLSEFEEYFQTDGRHHVWVGSPDTDCLLVYDQHDVIFGYGPIQRFRLLLTQRGFREEQFWFPAPHTHHYWSENDEEEERLMARFNWTYSPLRKEDQWA